MGRNWHAPGFRSSIANRQIGIAGLTIAALAHVPEKWEPVFR
jgi:hypothetical protein